MLFNSYQFIFIFLPITYFIFYFLVSNKKIKILTSFILLSSLVFYGVSSLNYLLLLIFSILVNFYIGNKINSKDSNKNLSLYLKLGLLFNIVVLFIFKYFNFFIENLNFLGFNFPELNIVLPIGISFYTFQQIGFLMEISKSNPKKLNFIEYASFVSFFPQLIAGPILQYSDFTNQIKYLKYQKKFKKTFSLGIIIFILGLFKKIIVADTLSSFLVEPFYHFIEQGNTASTLTAWIGTLSYSMQIYFDFSAYSEMAIGLGLLFGFTLPINFDSPFQSHSLIEYWGRWNITLSNFISNYVYQPTFKSLFYLSSNFFNNHILAIIIAMSISGIWHGANWNFLLWGTIHGFALAINHYFRAKKLLKFMPIFLKRIFLMIFVNTSFVIFKNTDLSLIKSITYSLFPIRNIVNNNINFIFANQLYSSSLNLLIFFFILTVVIFFPSTLKLIGYESINNTINLKNSIFNRFKFNNFYTFMFSLLITICFSVCILYIHRENEFIYFQF